MRMIVVHPTDPRADARSCTQALQAARAGDVVLLNPGTYSPSRTGEVLPLRIPPGVTVAGAGQEASTIDGEGLFEPSFNPIRPDAAVVLLDDGATLSGVTVANGGGHGIGVPPGAAAAVHNCAVSRHGDHGVFLCGVSEAVVTGCVFQENGRKRFEPALPRGAGARQGHHIFAEARHGQRNRLLIADNTMRGCFADGIAFICFFPEADGVSFSATIVRNTIEASERGGLLFSCSFGPSRNRLRLTVADNVLRANKQFGLGILAAVPLADKVPQGGELAAVLAGNEVSASPLGVSVQGAVGEAHHNTCRVTLDRNRISDCGKNAVRLVGAMGAGGVDTRGNTLQAAVSRNRLTGGTPVVAIQGAGGAGNAQQNTVKLRLYDNEVDTSPEQAVMISDGRAGNVVEVLEGGQAYMRTDKDLLK
ncbi:MAG TPA: right-handed parallel beta-helix repeat-containing protein [Candidatus Binatia bacterium]|nr:right-handed parallel beta-helix repeat-containing protein [Candidatus Binatia bacterium]